MKSAQIPTRFKKARQADQKDARRKRILDAARALFAREEYGEISMERIAAKATLAKGTLYLYYPTKEELFLSLAREELATWFGELKQGIELFPPRASLAELVGALTLTLEGKEGLLRLLALLHVMLEANSDANTVLEFKRTQLESLRDIARALASRLRATDEPRVLRALLSAHALIIGLWQVANPPPRVRLLHERSELAVFRIDFFRELPLALTALLAGQLQITSGS